MDRRRRAAAAGLSGALLLGALTADGALLRLAPAGARTPPVVVAELAPAPPGFAGLVPATAVARDVGWRLTASDVLGDAAPGASARSRLRVAPAQSPPPPDHGDGGWARAATDDPVIVLAQAVGEGAQAVARLAGVDRATGEVRWRGPVFADIAGCARLPAGDVACLERFERGGRLVILRAVDGAPRVRTDLTGRPSTLAADSSGLVGVAATPAGTGTEIVLTRWAHDGSARWSRTYAAPAAVTPGITRHMGGAIVVEQVTVDGAALIVDAEDGTLAQSRPDGAAVGIAHGRVLFDRGGERLATGDGPIATGDSPLADGGQELRGTPMGPAASDGTVALPTLTRRFGTRERRAPLTASPAPGAPGVPWSLPGALPLAACAGHLVLAVAADQRTTDQETTDRRAIDQGSTDRGVTGPAVTLRAVDPATGATRWEAALPGASPRTAACTPRTVLVPASTPGLVLEYDLATGAPREPTSGADPLAPTPGSEGVDLVTDGGALLAIGADASGAAWVTLLS